MVIVHAWIVTFSVTFYSATPLCIAEDHFMVVSDMLAWKLLKTMSRNKKSSNRLLPAVEGWIGRIPNIIMYTLYTLL